MILSELCVTFDGRLFYTVHCGPRAYWVSYISFKMLDRYGIKQPDSLTRTQFQDLVNHSCRIYSVVEFRSKFCSRILLNWKGLTVALFFALVTKKREALWYGTN